MGLGVVGPSADQVAGDLLGGVILILADRQGRRRPRQGAGADGVGIAQIEVDQAAAGLLAAGAVGVEPDQPVVELGRLDRLGGAPRLLGQEPGAELERLGVVRLLAEVLLQVSEGQVGVAAVGDPPGLGQRLAPQARGPAEQEPRGEGHEEGEQDRGRRDPLDQPGAGGPTLGQAHRCVRSIMVGPGEAARRGERVDPSDVRADDRNPAAAGLSSPSALPPRMPDARAQGNRNLPVSPSVPEASCLASGIGHRASGIDREESGSVGGLTLPESDARGADGGFRLTHAVVEYCRNGRGPDGQASSSDRSAPAAGPFSPSRVTPPPHPRGEPPRWTRSTRLAPTSPPGFLRLRRPTPRRGARAWAPTMRRQTRLERPRLDPRDARHWKLILAIWLVGSGGVRGGRPLPG